MGIPINEATIIATYHRASRYHALPLTPLQCGQTLVLGDPLVLEMKRRTERDDWREPIDGLYAILDLYQATGKSALLELAVGVGDGLAASQTETGLFPRGDRAWARTGDEAPLALLHLAATLAGNRDQPPRASIDSATFHVRYSGPLEPYQQKPGDARTTDGRVFYGR